MTETPPSTEVFKRVLGYANIDLEFYTRILDPARCRSFRSALALDTDQKADLLAQARETNDRGLVADSLQFFKLLRAADHTRFLAGPGANVNIEWHTFDEDMTNNMIEDFLEFQRSTKIDLANKINTSGLKRSHDPQDISAEMRKKPRLVFEGTEQATVDSFATVWLVDLDETVYPLTDEHGKHNHGSLFTEDAYIRKEYVEMYDVIQHLKEEDDTVSALVQGSSGIGKSAFLRYLLARIRANVNNVLVVQEEFQGAQFFLHLTTDSTGKRIVRGLTTIQEAIKVGSTCDWTIVDGCDWPPRANNFVCAASPSTTLTQIKKSHKVMSLCMPPWSLEQLKDCARLTGAEDARINLINENYQIVGGIARHVFAKKKKQVIGVVTRAINDVDFGTVSGILSSQLTNKATEREMVHMLVLWNVPKDKDENWKYIVDIDNPIHYKLISPYAAKKLAEKAVNATIQERQKWIKSLKSEIGAASVFRGVLYEVDAIDTLVKGGDFYLYKCKRQTSDPEVTVKITLNNKTRRFPMEELHKLNVKDCLDYIVVPNASNFESIDAFCVMVKDNGPGEKNDVEILQFQMTVGLSHPIKRRGVLTVLNKIKASFDAKIYTFTNKVIFVVPEDKKNYYEKCQQIVTLKNEQSSTCKVFGKGDQYRLVVGNYDTIE